MEEEHTAPPLQLGSWFRKSRKAMIAPCKSCAAFSTMTLPYREGLERRGLAVLLKPKDRHSLAQIPFVCLSPSSPTYSAEFNPQIPFLCEQRDVS